MQKHFFSINLKSIHIWGFFKIEMGFNRKVFQWGFSSFLSEKFNAMSSYFEKKYVNM